MINSSIEWLRIQIAEKKTNEVLCEIFEDNDKKKPRTYGFW